MKEKHKLKILIVSMKYSYGKPDLGLSYDWLHFYLGLRESFIKVDFFDYMDSYQSQGQHRMQANLFKIIQDNCYDVVIFILFEDQFTCDFINSLKKITKTLSFFHDDNWRQAFVRKWAPCFSAFTTTDIRGVEKYRYLGLEHAFFVPFGVNETLFCANSQVEKDIDISFVGAWHPYRQWLLQRIKRAGYKVSVFGEGWPQGIIDESKMIEVFQRSKISLNLSNSISYDVRYLLSSVRGIYNSLRSPKRMEQLKGRHFEIPACGAMQLSYYVEGLESVFQIGKEMVVYVSPEDLIEKIEFYLRNNDSRMQIAEAGYARVQKDHIYAQRFVQVFKGMGLLY